MLFPISDDDRKVTTFAFVTYALLAANVIVFLLQMSNPEITYGWSIIPKEITTGVDLVESQYIVVDGVEEPVEIPQAPGPPILWLTIFSSMFMHGGAGHIGGNMLYLWIFGNNVEHRFGHLMFLMFYLLSGVVGAAAQIVMEPQGVIPNLGASGAIAGVMGAYLVLFPRNKVNAVFFYTIISIPAIFVLGMWGAMQFMSGVGSIVSEASSGGGVAYMAHVGGFVTGLAAAFVCKGFLKQDARFLSASSVRQRPNIAKNALGIAAAFWCIGRKLNRDAWTAGRFDSSQSHHQWDSIECEIDRKPDQQA